MKNVIFSIIIIVVLMGIYFGAYQPWEKGQGFLSTKREMISYRTMDKLTSNFDEKVFDLNSPVGQAEVVKFFANDMLSIIVQDQPEDVSRALVDYVESKIIEGDIIHYLRMASLYGVLWQKFDNKQEDFEKTEMYYRKSLEIGPSIPNVLYPLLNLYQKANDAENVLEIGEMILERWPDDEEIKQNVNISRFIMKSVNKQ